MIRARGDHGKIAVYFAVLAPAWAVMLALVVVGGGRVRAYQKAYNVAAEAARAAGQGIDRGSAIAGGTKRIDPVRARSAAMSYLASVGATGTVVIDSNLLLTVTAKIQYRNPSGLPALGGPTWTATGTATARLVIG